LVILVFDVDDCSWGVLALPDYPIKASRQQERGMFVMDECSFLVCNFKILVLSFKKSGSSPKHLMIVSGSLAVGKNARTLL